MLSIPLFLFLLELASYQLKRRSSEYGSKQLHLRVIWEKAGKESWCYKI